MALLDEARVRLMSDNGARGPVVVRRGDVLTPSARSWLREHRVEVVFPQGEPPKEEAPRGGQRPAPRYRTLFGAALEEKPEHMTHLKGNVLVFKDHPRIVFRGWIDLLEAELLLCQQTCAGAGYRDLTEELGEALAFVRRCIRYDVLEEPVGELRLCGMGPDELPALLAVNKVRTVARQTELAAYRAFRDENGAVAREDILLGLNRLSSLFWIMMIKLKGGAYERHD